ncbi:lysophospholipase L1-like esterase [Desulfosporosinus acidiphilus SJ4]|uniref:Lysophospholipase L1-like esterase n=1 Tax=Desulfosporosinus acidiphilus (strain DSM 22704 / JCM 16185 / SJ4) TaxID=646529 RepID=I4DBQ8_DESAJ|nr:GDSL-type esterase/lipase family protein [Desulfosporosinus acidiphilus]AFM43232.1 lysophospholipase L1-like esterase [Desulfosporosinus acidiphilus SJ4]
MRTYRLEIRLIQAATALALIVLITGFLGLWGQVDQPSGAKAGAGETRETTSVQTQTPSNSKIVALGDSFTLGYPLDTAHSWTQRLADDLKIRVVNKGKGGQTSKDLLARFDADVVSEKPGRVIIFVGTGDALQSVPLKDFQANVETMIEKAKANNIIPIVALPIWYPNYQKGIQEIRDWEIDYAKKQSITTLDFTTVLFDSSQKYLTGLASDNGKYPNAKGYEKMGDYAANLLKT